MTEVLLKARPTKAQLADRMSDPVPPGLELYLDTRDVGDLDRLEKLAVRLNELRPHPGFVYVVEGPLRSLDGAFFDVSADSEAQRECVRRIAWLASEIRAEAVLIHAIAPRKLSPSLTHEMRVATLQASLPFVQYYVELIQSRGMVPMLENIPPVARQREATFMCTPIGMSASDLVFFARRFPGLKVTVDVSHAQLFLNGLRIGRGTVGSDMSDTSDVSGVSDRLDRGKGQALVPQGLEPLVGYLSSLGDEPTMDAYLSELDPYLFEAHISNARGLLDEGLPYGVGDMDLDRVAVRLSRSVHYLVTETIEPDANRGSYMREAQRRLEAALAAASR